MSEDIIIDHLYFNYIIQLNHCFQDSLVMEVNNRWQYRMSCFHWLTIKNHHRDKNINVAHILLFSS